MSKNSITTKISIFFGLFVVLIFAISAGVLQAHFMHEERKFFERIFSNLDSIPQYKNSEDIYIKALEATLLSDKETREVLATQKPLRRPPPPPPPLHGNNTIKDMPHHQFEALHFYGNFFRHTLIVDINGKQIGLRDGSIDTVFYFYFIAIFFSILCAITLLYVAIIKSLKPLKELEKEIEAFGFGVKPQIAKQYPKNEIGNIQKAFHMASNKIASLLDAREIFLKNAAHELKTPIAKGVIVAHMIDGEKQQKRLLEIFSSMTQIIEGIMTAEELIAKGFTPKIEPIMLHGFCGKIRKKLLIEPSDLVLSMSQTTIVMADAKLFEIALANLLENAVKFKDVADPAECLFENGKIIVKNHSQRLEEPIDRYFEPFYKETSIRNENGMGLGLYLTKKVLEIQGLKFSYEHKDGKNMFIIG